MTKPAPGASDGTTADRRGRHRRGVASEILAAAYLMCRGYRILARRFRASTGEIDLIARRGRLVAFVEVKRRRDKSAAESAVTPKQRQRIRRAAEIWIARNQPYATHDRRFDVILILPRSWPRHIEGGL